MEAALAIPVQLASEPVPSPASGPCPVCPRIASEFEGWRQAAYWQALHGRAVDREVPLDNNTAERAQRGPVVGRKNYYGSGAEWSGRLATMLFSLFQTLSLAKLNPHLWLTGYLNACAAAGGQAPADADKYLPWNLTDEQKREWSSDREPPATDTS